MVKEPLILVVDRNRHVREFLYRELLAEGYRVRLAKDDKEVLDGIHGGEPPALLVLDLEIPVGGGLDLIDRLRKDAPNLPIVVHTLSTEYSGHAALKDVAAFVEKTGDTKELKTAIAGVLSQHEE